MSTLNNSVIICYENPKPMKEKAFSRKKKVQRNVKRTFYESPLKHIQLSSKRWAQAQKRLLFNTNQVFNKRKDSFCFAKESLQDSVIILSDNENESNNKDDESKQELQTRKRFLDLSINGEGNPHCNSNETLSQTKTAVEGPPRKKRKKNIVALSENNSTCPSVSNTIIDLDDENTALVSDSINQSLDDIVVVWSSTETVPSSAETIPSSVETVPPSAETVPQSVEILVPSVKTPPCAKTSLPSVNQSKEEPINRKKNDRIFMIDTTPNKNNLSCLQSNEDILQQYETNTEKDAKNKKVEEEESAKTCLPFSKRRLKFPKPHNISKNIIMTKPKTTQRLRNLKRSVTNYTTSTFTSTTSTISTTFNTPVTSTISTAFNTSIIPTISTTFDTSAIHTISNTFDTSTIHTISTTFDTSTIHTISSTSTLPFVYNMPVAYNYPNLYEFPNPGFQTTFEPSFISYPQLSTTGSSVPQPLNSLREIVIDGNNIAMAYRKHKIFAEEGIRIVVEYFQKRGHSVKVFVPHYRRSLNHPLLEKLYTDGIVIFTPSRVIGGKRITPYDDRYILEYATMCGGIVVSLDQYRDLYLEKPEWRDTIEKRLLIPTFVGNYVMFPEDPLGRGGPTLEEFLRH